MDSASSSVIKDFNLESFYKNGIYRHPELAPEAYILSCKKIIISHLHSLYPDSFCSFGYKDFNSQAFHEALSQMRANKPTLFGILYDALQSSLALKKFASSSFISSIACKLLDCPSEVLMLRNSIIRFDAPFDTRNTVDWHFDQFSDSSHYPADGLTVVIPLTDFYSQNGAPIFCVGSHLVQASQNVNISPVSNNSASYKIPHDYLDKFHHHTLESCPGAIWAFPMTLVHRSGYNKSSLFRVSLLFRYYNISSTTYVPIAESFRTLDSKLDLLK